MKRMKSLHLFVVFASVALSYVILSACSSDDAYDMNNGMTLASGMMTRAEGDAGVYPGSSADSINAVIEKRTIQVKFNDETLQRSLTYSIRFSINPNNTTVSSAEIFYFYLPYYDESSASAEISNVDLEKRKCNVKLTLPSNYIYNEKVIEDNNVTFKLD